MRGGPRSISVSGKDRGPFWRQTGIIAQGGGLELLKLQKWVFLTHFCLSVILNNKRFIHIVERQVSIRSMQ